MIKFCNVFLLNLIILSGRHHFEARVVSPRSLKYVVLNVKEAQDLPEFNQNNILFRTQTRNSEPHNFIKFSETPTYKAFIPGGVRDQKPMDLKCPLRKDKILPKAPFKWTDNWYNDCLNEVANKWSGFRDRRRIKTIDRRQVSGNERPSSFLDYTNSQMPFNEGKLRPKSLKCKLHQFPDSLWEDDKRDLFVDPSLNTFPQPKRFQRSVMRRRFEVPLKSQEKVFETPRDDPVLGYSRVRRFLDHERAKKRKRMPGTLEAKEAAMSRILDPNLNLDGILEPHVRKRRGHSKKRDLSFNPLYMRS